VPGCWLPDAGGNFYGAYSQERFAAGFKLSSDGTKCEANINPSPGEDTTSSANLQTFHSEKVAIQGAAEQASSTSFLAVYQGGVLALSVTQESRPEFAQAVERVAQSNLMFKVPGS
jgi:hypothetical protein